MLEGGSKTRLQETAIIRTSRQIFKDIKDDEVARTHTVRINPKGKTPIYSPKRKLECNIKTNL